MFDFVICRVILWVVWFRRVVLRCSCLPCLLSSVVGSIDIDNAVDVKKNVIPHGVSGILRTVSIFGQLPVACFVEWYQ